jgi:hypothetical protein
MNERIKQLAQKAYEDVIKNTPSFLVTKELYEQKFAELIVRECCEVAHCNFHVDGLTLGTILKEHFGVEE